VCVCVCFSVCLCSLIYPGCKPQAPYYIAICALYSSAIIFSHYRTYGTIFWKKTKFSIQNVFWFSFQLSTATFLILRIRRDIIKVHRPFRWERDFPPVQTGPGAHPASCKMGAGSFPGVKCGRGVLLTAHPLLVPRSKATVTTRIGRSVEEIS